MPPKSKKSAKQEQEIALAKYEAGEAPTTSGAWLSPARFHPGCTGYISHFFHEGVLPAFTPSAELRLTYASGAGDYGTQMELKGCVRRPPMTISWGHKGEGEGKGTGAGAVAGADGDLYTLIVADPDQPMRHAPSLRSILLWLVCNLPSAHGRVGNGAGMGTELMAWQAPKPDKGTHRIMFLLCRQTKGALPATAAPTARVSFSIPTWLSTHGLQPIGLNFVCVHPEY